MAVITILVIHAGSPGLNQVAGPQLKVLKQLRGIRATSTLAFSEW